MIVIAIIGSLLSIAVTAYARARNSARAAACSKNLDALATAKLSWAFDQRKSGDAVPADADLFGPYGYLVSKPSCPAGGIYSYEAVDDDPVCSLAGSQNHKVKKKRPSRGNGHVHNGKTK